MTNITVHLIYTANCGLPPPPPQNGHIIPYTNTLEGAIVTYVCWIVHQEENISLCTEINTTAVCSKDGNWEPDSQDMCLVFSGQSKSYNYYAHFSLFSHRLYILTQDTDH